MQMAAFCRPGVLHAHGLGMYCPLATQLVARAVNEVSYGATTQYMKAKQGSVPITAASAVEIDCWRCKDENSCRQATRSDS